MGAAGYLVATALQAIIAQRLVRKICEHCSAPYTPDSHEHSWLVSQIGKNASNAIFKAGQGCTQCNNTGYNGRIGVFEFLELDAELEDALRRENSADFTRAARKSDKYKPFSQHAIEYALSGVTTIEEVLRVSSVLEEELELEQAYDVAIEHETIDAVGKPN